MREPHEEGLAIHLGLRLKLDPFRWNHHAAVGADDLCAMAFEFGLGNRHASGRKHDHQRGHAVDGVRSGT